MAKNKEKKKVTLIGLLALIIVVLLVAVTVYIMRYKPTKKTMNTYSYFGMETGSDKVLVSLNDENYYDQGFYNGDRLYIKQDLIESDINLRFYYDKETKTVCYSDTHHIYTFKENSKEYLDEDSQSYNSDYEILINKEGTLYLDWEYVASHTDLEYEIAKKPNRLVVNTSTDEIKCANAKGKVAIRYRGGVKSPIVETVKNKTRLHITNDYGTWIEVISPTGVKGYVRKNDLSDSYSYTRQTSYKDDYTSIKYDKNINLTWFQVSGAAGNATVDGLLANASGINVISPTWYSITGADGSLSFSGTKEFVDKMHGQGIKVWALVDDFDKSIDFTSLYQSKAARSKMVNRLISDAVQYGYDGINLDFENVKKDFSRDFLEFVRELSIECEKKGIVLSTDNYKPEAYNSCYRLKEQASFVDYVVLMAYDEHHAGSEPGSVSSLPFVKEGIDDMKKEVPSDQLVVGLPFFTRIWATANGETTSSAVGMNDAIKKMTDDGYSALWNDELSQYIVSYEKDGKTIQIWFEEAKSFEAKLKVVKEADVAGVASWKLGLEQGDVWPLITSYINN